MGIIDRIFGRGDGIAAKALQKPAWWGNVWNTDTVSESGEYGDSPTGRIGAVKHNVWAYNCVQARMAAVAQAPMKLYRGVGDEKQEIDNHPVLDLLQVVNPVNLNARSFRRGIEQQLSLHGRCIVQKVRGVGAGVKELYILPMNFLEIEEDAREWIKGFTWLPTNTLIPRADVIDINYPSLEGDVESDSPTSVALDAINRYNLADTAQASIDRRGGQKGGMVIHPPQTIQADFDRARAEWDRWRKNPNNAGRDMHVSAGFDWRGDAFSSSEMQREERMHRIAKEIMAPYRVPPAAAGDFRDASVLANASVQMRSLWDLFAVDECAFIAEELTYSLLHAEWPDTQRAGLYFEHDLSQIPAMREDNDSRVQRAIALNASNLASVNEARDIAGLEKSDDVAADRIMMEASQADVVADPAPLMAIMQSFAAGAIAESAAATLLRIAAPNLTDEQVAALLTQNPQKEVIENAGTLQAEEEEDQEVVDDEMDAFDAEEGEIDAEIDAILGEDAAKADGAFDEAKVERKGGQFAPKGSGESAASTPKRKRATTPEAKKRMMDRRVSKAREVEASMTEDIARLDEAEANADDRLKKRIGKLRDRLKKRLTDAMTIIESNGATMPKRRRTSAVDKLLGSAESKPTTNDAVDNLPVVKAVDTSIDDPWTPPQAVQRAAEKGLKLREEFGRGGTMVGVARARDLSNGKRIPPETINRMLSYFARHEVDKQAEDFGNDDNPSPGYIAWLLWGGDAGQAWVNRIEREYPAETKALPYVDPVGLVAETLDGDELGVIDALHRGGIHDGVKASVKVPVFAIAGKAYAADTVMVRHA